MNQFRCRSFNKVERGSWTSRRFQTDGSVMNRHQRGQADAGQTRSQVKYMTPTTASRVKPLIGQSIE